MKVRLEKRLVQNLFYVIPVVSEISSTDREWFKKFGQPELKVLNANGAYYQMPLGSLDSFPFGGFSTQAEAESYADELRQTLKLIKESMLNRKDNWSGIEEL